MAFPGTDLDIIIRAYLGADPTADPGTWPAPTDLSSRLLRRPIQIRRGRGQNQGTASAGACTFWLDNTDGALTPLLPTSTYYPDWDLGVPVDVSVDNVGVSPPYVRHAGFVADISAVMVPGVGGQNISAVKVTSAGVLRRLTQGAVAKSPLRRYIPAQDVAAAYWPMEGYDQKPDVVESAIPGVSDATHRTTFGPSVSSPLDWSGDATLVGSQALPRLERNQTAVAGIQSTVEITPAPAVGLAFWTRTEVPRSDAAQSINTQAIQTVTVGGVSFGLVLVTYPPGSALATVPAAGEVTVRTSYSVGGVLTDFVDATDLTFVDGWRHVYASFSTSGGDVAVSLRLDNVVVGTGTLSPASLGAITAGFFSLFGQDAVNDEIAVISGGHPVILSGSTADLDVFASGMYNAGLAYPGERAYDRIARLCAEDGIPFSGTAAPSVVCGAQPIADVVAVLQDAEAVDHGVLTEDFAFGLGYRASSQRFNLDPVITVDLATYRTTSGTQGDVLTPVRNDARIRNEWTISRPDGASKTSKDETHQAKRGRYNDSATVNVEDDDHILDEATWRVHEGTFDGLRYQTVPLDIAANL